MGRQGPHTPTPTRKQPPGGGIEQGDEGGGLEAGQSALGGLFLEVIHTTEALCFLVRLGKYFQSNVRAMLLSLTLGPKMVRAM